jgi:hypothetical protein
MGGVGWVGHSLNWACDIPEWERVCPQIAQIGADNTGGGRIEVLLTWMGRMRVGGDKR